MLVKKYISSYNLIIGNENFRTTDLLENNNLNNFTYTNLLKNINIIYNNDSNSNNVNSYNLTIDTVATINVYNNSLIYDMNNTLYNTNRISSSFLQNQLVYFNKTDVCNINIFFK